MRIQLSLALSVAAVGLAACSPGTASGPQCGSVLCPPGCSASVDCQSCVPDAPDAGYGEICVTNADCCQGDCIGGICSAVEVSGAATGTTSGAATTGGTTSRSASAGTTHGTTAAAAASTTAGASHGTSSAASSTTAATTSRGVGIVGAASGTTGRAATTGGFGGSIGGSTSGSIPVGDTCSPCNTYADCSGQTDWCVVDPSSDYGACAPDCTSGTCAAGYTCTIEADSDGVDEDQVCYPSSGACSGLGGTGGTIGGLGGSGGSIGGSSSGGSNVGASCSSDSQCTSDYCRSSTCTCNCGGATYVCRSDADCCTGPGQGNSCSSAGYSTGCVGGLCY